jgi:hypothetical protein
MQVAALEGTYASVIGGAPAAAVVFAREVDVRTRKDPRVQALEAAVAGATGPERARLRAELAEVSASVRSEKLGDVAAEFDRIHSVERAMAVGSVHRIIPAAELRPLLAGLVPLVGRVVDAVTDPLMGRISDRTRWRWGRRRPYLLLGAVPFGVAFDGLRVPAGVDPLRDAGRRGRRRHG